MTSREKEIEEGAKDKCEGIGPAYIEHALHNFKRGAQWADSHPITIEQKIIDAGIAIKSAVKWFKMCREFSEAILANMNAENEQEDYAANDKMTNALSKYRAMEKEGQ